MREDPPPSEIFSLTLRPGGLLMASGLIACVGTALGFLGAHAWYLDLFSHFRVQYLLGLGILGPLMFVGGHGRVGALFVGFACLNLVWVAPLYLGTGERSTEGVSPHRAMLINVNTQTGDVDRVLALVQRTAPDILVLEEVNGRWMEALEPLTSSMPFQIAKPRGDNFGIAVFSRFELSESEIISLGGRQVPSIITSVDLPDGSLRLIATHPLPPIGHDYATARNDQLQALGALARGSKPLLLLGDLNATPFSAHFQGLIREGGLLNSARGFGVQGSWPSQNPLLRIPLDHCLHSDDIVTVNREIGPDVGSDHFPVIVDFAIVD